MATQKGVWNLQQVRDKQLQSLWSYSSSISSFFIWGRNQFGELGQNSPAYAARSSPTQIPGSWSKITCNSGAYSAGGIKTDGTLWAWGRNNYGQLGQNQKDVHYSSPVQIPGTWSEAEIGATNSYGINTSGELFVMGFDNDGAMGVNTKSVSYSSPVQIPGSTWSIVKGLHSNFLAIKTDGTMWSWGTNSSGKLGLSQATSFKASSPTQIGTGTDWSDISISGSHCGAINTSGELWMWGAGSNGRLGQNAAQSKSSPVQIPGTTWAQVKCDHDRTYARKTDNTLWVWGDNENGTLGLNQAEATYYSSPVQIGSDNDFSSVGATQMMGVALKML